MNIQTLLKKQEDKAQETIAQLSSQFDCKSSECKTLKEKNRMLETEVKAVLN